MTMLVAKGQGFWLCDGQAVEVPCVLVRLGLGGAVFMAWVVICRVKWVVF